MQLFLKSRTKWLGAKADSIQTGCIFVPMYNCGGGGGGGFKKLELQIQDFSGIAVDPKALFF